jgi:hypothetical protein
MDRRSHDIRLDPIEYRAWCDFGPEGEFRRLVRSHAEVIATRRGASVRILAPGDVELERIERPR